jgi:hypothetical protein
LPPDVEAELTARVQDLQRRTAEGSAVGPHWWRELDELGQRLERERLLMADAPPAERGPGGELAATAAARIAELVEPLLAAGGPALSAAARALLANVARPDGTIDASRLPQSPGELAQWARALAAAGIDVAGALANSSAAQHLAELARSLGGVAGDLEAALAGAEPRGGSVGAGGANQSEGAAAGPAGGGGQRAVGQGSGARAPDGLGQGDGPGGGRGDGPGDGPGDSGQGDSDSGPGGGRAGRGGGRAALKLTEHTAGSGEQSLPLPRAEAQPGEWVPIADRPRAPDVAPVANENPGGAATAGTAGASWQLRLSPRHRAVVQRFFSAGTGEGKR